MGEDLLLLHPRTLEVKLLNETASILWEALPAWPTAEALTALLVEARPELDPATAAAYVAALLETLLAAGLIEQRPESSP